MTPGAPREHRCSFCNTPLVAIEANGARLIYSSVGGLPPAICTDCARDIAASVEPAREDAPA